LIGARLFFAPGQTLPLFQMGDNLFADKFVECRPGKRRCLPNGVRRNHSRHRHALVRVLSRQPGLVVQRPQPGQLGAGKSLHLLGQGLHLRIAALLGHQGEQRFHLLVHGDRDLDPGQVGAAEIGGRGDRRRGAAVVALIAAGHPGQGRDNG
jgi:hypothetical protein